MFFSSHRASDVEPRELVNAGAVEVEGFKQPVVRFSSRLELQSADRVVDVLQAALRQDTSSVFVPVGRVRPNLRVCFLYVYILIEYDIW